MILRNMKIKKRLTLSFLLFTVIISLSGMISLVFMGEFNKRYSAAIRDYGFAQGDIGKAIMVLANNRTLARDIVGSDKTDLVAHAQQRLQEIRQTIIPMLHPSNLIWLMMKKRNSMQRCKVT